MNNFEIKKKIVEKGDSRTFQNWHTYQGISQEEFINELEWLCKDPLNDRNQLTRELGCKDSKLHRLKRAYYDDGSFAGFYHEDTGMLWHGHVSISAWDRV